MADTLLTHVLDHFMDCCRTYYDHKRHEPVCPGRESLGFGRDQRAWVDYERAHKPWKLNHFAHENEMSNVACLLKGSSFSPDEKVEITSRLAVLEVHYKGDEVIMGRIGEIRCRQNLPVPVPANQS